jgi:hypothetical protein
MTARLSFNTACELGFRGSLDEWERLQGGERKVRNILPSGQRVIIGFCLIRQSSVSPIVSVHQSNQLSGPHIMARSLTVRQSKTILAARRIGTISKDLQRSARIGAAGASNLCQPSLQNAYSANPARFSAAERNSISMPLGGTLLVKIRSNICAATLGKAGRGQATRGVEARATVRQGRATKNKFLSAW